MIWIILSDAPFLSETQIGIPNYRNIEPHIAVNGNNVLVVWMRADASGNIKGYLRYSSDGGTTWEPARQLPASCNTVVDPFVRADPDNPNGFYLVYLEICPRLPRGHNYFVYLR